MIEIRIRRTYGGLDYEDVYENIPMEVDTAICTLLRNIKYGRNDIKMHINDLTKKENEE